MARSACRPRRRGPESPRLYARHLAVLHQKPAKVSKGIDFDRKLYIVRRVFEQASNGTYVPSLSSRTIVYKGMFLVHDLRQFYLDLQDEDYESAIGMVHSRFSTNTNPSWMRAHPNRFILHNGEINTIKGNTDAMLAREETISSPIMKEDMNKILPIINTSGSDSAMLDNALEFMVMNGMDLPLAVMITIPEPWENNKNISQKSGTSTSITPPCWNPGTALPPSSSPMATWWALCWTATVCAPAATTSPKTAG